MTIRNGLMLGLTGSLLLGSFSTSAEVLVLEILAGVPTVVYGYFAAVTIASAIPDFAVALAYSNPSSESALAAGLVMGVMIIPFVSSMADDSIAAVPQAMRDGSLAMGATRWQTVIRIIVPTSLSGIVSAILLGFGRVIGETMVVLLCAGNRIKIPDITSGLGVVFEPVHTMTGIIAQELGEVVQGSIHYRALFVVGICLFMISLIVNYFAQRIVLKFQESRG